MCSEIHVKNKRGLAEDFIGWVSDDGNLKVVALYDRLNRIARFKVICEICSKDPELFPEGYFVSTKQRLTMQQKPCGCSPKYEWSKDQILLKAQRVAENKRIKIHGIAGDFHGTKSKLDCECLIDGHRWKPVAYDFTDKGTGCPKCVNVAKLSDEHMVTTCKQLCDSMNYKFIGFPCGIKNSKSRFEYECPTHGIRNVSYQDFVNGKRRCKECYKESNNSNGNGFFPKKAQEQDFLYVLNFNDEFLKVGRSFDVKDRIDNLGMPSVSGMKNIKKFRVYTATHREIYNYEQKILNKLRPQYQHFCDWTTEALLMESLDDLNKLLNDCNFIRVL